MDTEIEDIKRRAGILTEQGEVVADMATFETLNNFLNDEYEFLGNLGQVLGRAMAPDRARQVLGVIGERRRAIQQMARQEQAKARQSQDPRQKQSADAHADVEQPGARQQRSYGYA